MVRVQTLFFAFTAESANEEEKEKQHCCLLAFQSRL
jgi:hypothetical protein